MQDEGNQDKAKKAAKATGNAAASAISWAFKKATAPAPE